MGFVDSSAPLIATCGGDTVKLFDLTVSAGDPCTLIYTPSPGSQVNSIKWNHTNLVIASAGDDKKISLWNKNGQSMGFITSGHDLVDHIEESIHSISFSNKSSRYLCSGGSGHIVKIWDLQRKRCIKWLSGHTDTITGVIYNYKDEHLASVSVKGDLILHNLTSGARAAELKDPNGQVLRVVDYSRFSRHILCTAGDDGSVHLWDTTGRSPMVSWPKQHSAPATGVCFSPSSDKIIASAGLDKKLYTFDSATKRHTSCMPFEAPFSSLAYSNVRGKPQPFTVLRAYSSSEDDNPIQSFATTKDTSSRSELSLSSHSDTWIGSRESSSAFFSTKSSLMNPIPTVASVNLQNKVPYSSSTTGMESSSDYHPTSVFMPLGNQIIPSLANLKLEGTVPSALPGRFTTYSERISTSAPLQRKCGINN